MAADEITLYYATEDPNTTPYSDLTVAAISGYAGYGSINIRILDPGQKYELEGEETRYIDGEIKGKTDYRKTFELVIIPFTYESGSWDVGDIDAIVTALRKPHKWLALNAYSTQFNRSGAYHSSSHAVPVEVMDVQHTNDRKAATESLTVKFSKKWGL